jgi:hypothetical protein
MKSILFRLLLLTFLCSCANVSVEENTSVLKYEEFGPPALANNLIGMDWWQWQSHGDSRPKKYDINVVVYKDVDLKKVKHKYPVSPKDLQDFRYVEYRKAIDYLDNAINENVIEELTQTLMNTKQKIQSTLNDGS